MDRQSKNFQQNDQAKDIQQFLRFIQDTKTAFPGVRPSQSDATQSKCPKRFMNDCFVPMGTIRDHFEKKQTIASILQDLFGPQGTSIVSSTTIERRYLKVFSILLFIGAGPWISEFTPHGSLADDKLPFLSKPTKFPVTTNSNERLWEKFENEQWHFCAWFFEDDHINLELDHSRILPFTQTQILDRGSSSTVFKVWLHPDYHDLSLKSKGNEPQDTSQHVFVIKSFDASDDRKRRFFEKEVNAFVRLKCNTPHSPQDIVKFYGSFIQNDSFNIMLEYADRGTLAKYFESTPPPRKKVDIDSFWRSLIPIISGVSKIHRVESNNDTIGVFQGFHQDLKPANVLIFSDGNESPYRFTAKIADLGLSHFIAAQYYLPNASARGSPGTRTYGSPENHQAIFESNDRIICGQGSDVWSLAAILSVAATWVVGGTPFIADYSHKREKARTDMDLTPSDCFHDDNKVLDVIETWHNDLVDSSTKQDTITESLWDHALRQAFLDNVHARSSVFQLQVACTDVINGNLRRNGTLHDAFPMRSPTTWAHSEESGIQHQGSPPRENGHHEWRLDYMPQNTRSATTDFSGTNPVVHSGLRGIFTQEPDMLETSSPPLTAYDPSSAGPFTPPRRITTLNQGIATPPTSHRGRKRNTSDDLSLITAPHYSKSPDSMDDWDQRSDEPSHRVDKDVNHKQALKSIAPPSNVPRHGPPRKEPCPVHDQTQRAVDCMTVKQLLDWKVNTDIKRVATIPHASHLNTLRQRDHVFLIDDAASMRKHWPELTQLFGAMAKFVKACDDDGIELYQTIDQSHMEGKSTTPLINKVKTLEKTLNASSEPEYVLDKIFDDHKKSLLEGKRGRFSRKKRPAPLSVYFFTDAKWSDRTNLAPVIKTVVDFLEQHHLGKRHFGIQFIQFGTAEDAKDKLRKLDNELGLVRDVVDTEPSTGNVWKMLLGAIDRSFDEAECNCDISGSETEIIKTG